MFFKELGDLPELPAPVAAIEPPESQRFSSAGSISRSGSNQFSSQSSHISERYDSQPTVSPVNEQSVASPQVYHPTEDPDSNPFMNGDDDDDIDG